MKNVCLLFLVLFLASCSYDDFSTTDKSITEEPEVSYARLINLAQKATALLEDKSQSRSIKRQISNPFKQIVSLNHYSSRSNTENLIYIVNYDNEQGFAIISAKEIKNPILGAVGTGSFVKGEEPEGFKFMLEYAEEYVANSKIVKPNPFVRTEYSDTMIVRPLDIIGPHIKVHWKQDGIFGSYCDNGVAGCSNVAIAQAMTYYGKPSEMTLSYLNNGGLNTIELDWEAYKDHSKFCYSECKASIHRNISLLLRELGHRSGSNYVKARDGKPAYTETYTFCTLNTLKDLGYKYTKITLNNQENIEYRLCNELIKKVILTRGSTYNRDEQNYDGHMWVIDGVKGAFYIINHYTYTGDDENGKATYSCEVEKINSMYYNHNWGWGAIFDGWLLADIYSPQFTSCDFRYFIEFYPLELSK